MSRTPELLGIVSEFLGGPINDPASQTKKVSFSNFSTLSTDITQSLSLSGFERNPFYYNNGNGTFTEIGKVIGIDTILDCRSIASYDFDNDGDLDLVIRTLQNPRLLYFENVVPTLGHYLRVTLEGTVSNKDGIGTNVLLVSGSHRQLQLLTAGDGFLTQHAPVLHFGLGNRERIDTLVITWPGGKTQTLTNIQANQTLHIVEQK